jgi:hypothetical protein
MENLQELKKSEMIEISGGVNPAYEIGYAIGSSFRHAFVIFEILSLFK